MSNLKIAKSARKFIRAEKAKIKKQFFDAKKQEEMINELYKGILKSDDSQVKELKPEKAAEEKPKKTAKKVLKTKIAKA